jgi:hypothetical protein
MQNFNIDAGGKCLPTVFKYELNINYAFQLLLAVCAILVYSSETSVDFQRITRRHILDDRNLHLFLIATFIRNIFLLESRTGVYYNEKC